MRHTGRLGTLGVVAACVLLTAGCSGDDGDDGGSAASRSSSSAAASSSSAGGGTYLALGDSVPFGYRGGESPEAYAKTSDFVGYPELAADELGLDVLNASCPGETTASFLDPTAQSNGCENSADGGPGFRSAYPLHVDYDAPDQSQLDLAVATLQDTDDVALVTLQIGANDAFLCQTTTADNCVSEVNTVASTVETNVGTILRTLRNDGGYDGQIVVVSYYAISYTDPFTAAATQLLDGAITRAADTYGATVASGFDAFQPVAQTSGGDSIAAGLVLPNDVHPTAKGQQLLADAVVAAVGG